jgi:hypothetical protein
MKEDCSNAGAACSCEDTGIQAGAGADVQDPHILVVPFNAGLIGSMKGRALVVRSSNPCEIPGIDGCVHQSGAHLHCIRLEADAPLSAIPVAEEWGSIPVALHVEEAGALRALRGKLKMLSKLNVKVFLPSNRAESFTSLRILSSLGIACGVSFNGAVADWEALDELMHYALYGRVEHGPVEPFHSIASDYRPSCLTDFSSIYFNSPRRYLHCDSSGNIAMTAGHLSEGIFIGTFPEALTSEAARVKLREYCNAWRSEFLTYTECSCCAGWRVCGGAFRGLEGAHGRCGGIMTEMLEGAELYQKRMREQRSLWQS